MPDTHTTSVDQQRLEKERIEDDGTVTLTRGGHAIHCLTVIGQVEGHTEAPQGQKTTKYEHVIPQLAAVQAGRLEDWELEGARSTLLNAYASMGDSQGKLENFYLGQAATGQEDTPELLAEQGIRIARRTVAKYRTELRLGSAAARKRD